MHELRRGDLYWLAEDDTHGAAVVYAHPHVVVQDDVFNRSRITTVIVCALSTNLHRATEPGNVLLDVGEGDLPRQSVVVVSRIASVERARLGARIGALSDARVEQILAGAERADSTPRIPASVETPTAERATADAKPGSTAENPGAEHPRHTGLRFQQTSYFRE